MHHLDLFDELLKSAMSLFSMCSSEYSNNNRVTETVPSLTPKLLSNFSILFLFVILLDSND